MFELIISIWRKYIKKLFGFLGFLGLLWAIFFFPVNLNSVPIAKQAWKMIMKALLSSIEEILVNQRLQQFVVVIIGAYISFWSINEENKIKKFLKKERTFSIKWLLQLFKKPSLIKIELEKNFFDEHDNRNNPKGKQKYENVFHCWVYNLDKKNALKNVSISLFHHKSKEEFSLQFHRFKHVPQITIPAGQREQAYLIAYNSDLSLTKLYIKRTSRHVDIDPIFDLSNRFTIKIVAEGQEPQFREFSIVVNKNGFVKCIIQYIEPQLSCQNSLT